MALLPAQVQPQDLAVAPNHAFIGGSQLNRHIDPINEAVSCQWGIVIPASSAVESPVFGDTQTGVDARLDGVVHPPGACRGHLQHKVRGFAHFADHVAVPVVPDCSGGDSECDNAVGRNVVRAVVGKLAEITLAPYQHV